MKRSVLVAASVLLASMSARAETVEVSRLDATTLQVNLSGVEGARTLWLAMDSSDKGDDAASWSHWCRVSDLPAGSTCAYAKIPKAESVQNCPFVRCFLFEQGKLPGAETLASATPSSAMVDTGFTPGGRTRVVMDVQLGNKAQALFCSRGSDNFYHTYTLFHIDDTHMRYDYGYDPKQSSFPYVLSIAAQTRYTFEMGPSGLSATHEGGKSSYTNQHPSDFISPSRMYLFAANNSGASPSAYFSGVFYSLKAWPEATDTATLALDLVPARKNGAVGVFDRAGGGFIAPVPGSMAAGAVVADAGTVCAVSTAVNVANYVGIESVDAASRTLTVETVGLSSASTLWVAYGTSDAGDDIVSWPYCAPVGEVPSGDACKTFRLPYGWNKSFTHIRCFVLTSGALPGATTLASVTPSSALVNTGFRPTGRSRVELDCQLASVTGQGVFCARNANNANSYSLMHMHATYCRFDYGSANPNVYFDQGMRQTIVTAPWGLAVVTNGIQSIRWTNGNPSEFEAGSDLYLFAAQSGGASPGSWFSGIFYGMKAFAEDLDAESLVLDLVPARRGGNVGLFNRATGEFLQPSNGGTLSAGSEVKSPANALAASRTHVCEACTVTVISQNDKRRTLTLAFTGVEADAELWVGMDAHDHMDDALGWSEYAKLADVPQGTRTAEVTLPASWGEPYRRLRCLLYSKGSVPGGERLAWLTTSGAYVPVGYTPTGKTAIEIKARYEDLGGNYAMFCARGSDGGTPYALLVVGGSSQLRYDYKSNNASTVYPVPPIHNNHSFLVDARGVYANGGLLRPNQYGKQDFTAGGELYLFAYHNAGTSFSGMANCTFSGARIWSDYEDPDSLLMDIVPYRKGDVVGLYDVKRREALPAYVGGTMTAGASRGDGVLAQSETVKYKKGLIIILGGVAPASNRRIKLFMAGDSTLDEHRGESNPLGYVSWGSSLRPYLKDNVDIVNYARAGFSTADFMVADPVYGNVVRWDRIKGEAESGDWVLIQFGHNDEKTLSVEQYKTNLRTMVSDVKAKGATPVLATPIVRLTFENGALVDNSYTPPLDVYADAMRAVAAETATQLAEMRELSRTAALKAGEAEALTWNVANDVTHLAQKGAELYASLFYGYINVSGLGFAGLFI